MPTNAIAIDSFLFTPADNSFALIIAQSLRWKASNISSTLLEASVGSKPFNWNKNYD